MLQLKPVSLSVIVGRINNEQSYVNLETPQYIGTEYSLCPVHMLLLQCYHTSVGVTLVLWLPSLGISTAERATA
jgi:hypothetical protein